MKRYRIRLSIMLMTLIASAFVSTSSAGAASCSSVNWGSQTKAGGLMHTPSMTTARIAKHQCYDQVVFEFAGKATGYRVNYTNEVYTQGKGEPFGHLVAGGALINVDLRSPATAYHHNPVSTIGKAAGYNALRQVVYGGTFEGKTTVAIGVRARLPFRVTVVPGPGSHWRISIDIAHKW